MRRPMIAGNWKMNKTPAETVALLNELKKIQPQTNVEVVVCPMTVSLFAAGPQLKGSDIKLGAQNVHFEDKGAFTGECNCASLKELGVEMRDYAQGTPETDIPVSAPRPAAKAAAPDVVRRPFPIGGKDYGTVLL